MIIYVHVTLREKHHSFWPTQNTVLENAQGFGSADRGLATKWPPSVGFGHRKCVDSRWPQVAARIPNPDILQWFKGDNWDHNDRLTIDYE